MQYRILINKDNKEVKKMEFTEEEKREIDRKLAMADEDMKNGRFYTNEESKKIINDWIRRLDYIYDNQTKNSSL